MADLTLSSGMDAFLAGGAIPAADATNLTGTAAGLTAGNATLASGLSMSGGGTVTGASGAITVTASGSDKNVTLTPSGTGVVAVTGNISKTAASTLTISAASGQNIQFSPGAGGSTTVAGGPLSLTGGSLWGRSTGCSVFLPQTGVLGFGSTNDNFGTNDSGFSRKTSTANWIKAGNGTANDASATFEAGALISNGTLAVTGISTFTGGLILPTSTTPSSASATGVAGTICRDSSYIYVCTATNTWTRVAIATW